jgi:predicted negative regulator of RcsB-dependent stress response
VPHITRRELKKDEFRDTLTHGAEALSEHKELIWQVAVIVLVAACAIFGWRYYWGRQTAQAGAALNKAMQVYDAPVAGSGQQALPGEKTFPTDAAKYEAAQQALSPVAEKYWHTTAGKMARYYAAVSLDHLGRYQDAVNWLLPMTKVREKRLNALARFELAQVYDDMGKSDQAVSLYQQLVKENSVFVPKPLVLLALGDHYRAKKNSQQAAKFYQQVKSEFPNTGLADQADQRLEMLGKT